MQRSILMPALLACALALPACITGRREADIDRTPMVDSGAGAAILMPGQTAPNFPRRGVAPGYRQI